MANSQKYGRTAQLFNYNTSVIGGIGSNGEDVWSDSARRSDYIQVKGSSTYTLSGNGGNIRFFVYDENKNYLNDNFLYSAPFTVSNNGYIRFAGGLTSVIDTIMLNEGSTALPYQPYIGWQHSLRKLTTATEAVENPLYSDGTPITAYTIKGNEEHTGTPSPSNPITISGVGNKTANLLPTNIAWYLNNNSSAMDKSDVSDIRIKTDVFPVSDTNAYLTVGGFNLPNIDGLYLATIRFYGDDLTTAIPSTGTNPRAIPTGAKWASLLYGTNSTTFDTSTIKSQMQVAQITAIYGQTAPLSYIPYGYEIPISSGQQTIDIYIGDLPLLKSLDGTVVDEISNGTLTRRVDADGSVLPTPTTTQITMPSIPTTQGANSISVDTTVQPSEFTATWTGWHNAYVKEYDGSDWQ